MDPFAEVTAEAREKAQEEPRFFGARMVEEVGRGSQGSLKRERELYGEDDHDFLRPKKIIQNGATVLPNWNGLGIQELGLEDLKDISRS